MPKNNDELIPFKSYSSGHLFSIAKQAYERTIGDKSDREPGKKDALIAVVFAASSLEAFVNELADLASAKLTEPHSETEKVFASLMDEVENSRGSIRLKFMLAKFVFSGTAFRKDERLFQDFNNLLMIRNALVHLKPEEEFNLTLDGHFVRVKEPKVLKALPKNILAKYEKKTAANWKSMISTQAVAKWACNTAVGMVRSILDTVPESLFQKMAVLQYSDTFQLIK